MILFNDNIIINDKNMGIETFPVPEQIVPQPEITPKLKRKNKGRMSPLKGWLTAGMITTGGIWAGSKAASPENNVLKHGKADSTQVAPTIKSHERRMEPQTIAFAQPSTSTAESSNIDSMLAAETAKSNYSVKVKGPDTEKVLGDQDAQKAGTIFQTGSGKQGEVDKKFDKLKKEHKQKKTTEISFVE